MPLYVSVFWDNFFLISVLCHIYASEAVQYCDVNSDDKKNKLII